MKILELIKSDPEIKYLYEIDQGRHLCEVPILKLEPDDKLKQVRDEDPKDVNALKSSLAHSGGAPLYPPVIFPEKQSDGSLRLLIVDGHQRLRAVKAEGHETMIIQIFTIWRTKDEAFDAGVAGNFSRYKVGEPDVFSIFAADPYYSHEKLIAMSGFSKSKIERLGKIAQHEDLVPLVKKKLIGPTSIVKLIDACGSYPEKLKALTKLLVEKYKHATTEAKRWKDEIRVNKNTTYSKQEKEKRELKTYFKGIDFDDWESSLKDELKDEESTSFVETDDGYVFQPESKKTDVQRFKNIRFGDENEWEEQIAIFGLSETPLSKVNPEQLKKEILDNWDDLHEKLQEVYEDLAEANRLKLKSKKKSTGKSAKARTRRKKPTVQSTKKVVVNSDEE